MQLINTSGKVPPTEPDGARVATAKTFPQGQANPKNRDPRTRNKSRSPTGHHMSVVTLLLAPLFPNSGVLCLPGIFEVSEMEVLCGPW
jgi:hypothetical protein